MTAAWLGDRLRVLPGEVMAQSFSSVGMSCLETHECLKPSAGSKMGQRGESWVEMCKCHLLGWTLCLTGSLGSREGSGDGEESRSVMQISLVTPETHAVGAFSKQGSLSSLCYFFLLTCYSCDTLSNKQTKNATFEGEIQPVV